MTRECPASAARDAPRGAQHVRWPLLAAAGAALVVAAALQALPSPEPAAVAPAPRAISTAGRDHGAAGGTPRWTIAPAAAPAAARQIAASAAPQPAVAPMTGTALIKVMTVPALHVGDLADVVVELGANVAVGEIGFTVQFDAQVLQARGASEGDWAARARAGSNGRFDANVGDGEDRVHVASALRGDRRARGGGVALVHFQAVAPGTTVVVISDVTVKDTDAKPMPFVLSASNLQVIVDSLPAPSHAARASAPAEAPPPETADDGD